MPGCADSLDALRDVVVFMSRSRERLHEKSATLSEGSAWLVEMKRIFGDCFFSTGSNIQLNTRSPMVPVNVYSNTKRDSGVDFCEKIRSNRNSIAEFGLRVPSPASHNPGSPLSPIGGSSHTDARKFGLDGR